MTSDNTYIYFGFIDDFWLCVILFSIAAICVMVGILVLEPSSKEIEAKKLQRDKEEKKSCSCLH